MIFRQLFDRESCTYTYLVANQESGEALIIDSVIGNVPQYCQLLEELGLKLAVAIDTHTHADHITGIGELSRRVDCRKLCGEKSSVEFIDYRFQDNETLEVGGLNIKALYTPGHTDDSYCFLLDDKILTGDTLFVRGTGRTDFQGGDARQMYDSIFKRLLTLPAQTQVYPGHDYKGRMMSTIGEEKRFNPRLQVASPEAFVKIMDGLNLPRPALIDVAVPANLKLGLC